MKKLNKLFYFIAMVVFFTSCEDVIQVKLDKGNPLVTVDAFVNNMRSEQKIRLTYTNDYFAKTKNDPVIGATVVVKDLTNGVSYNFTDKSNGDYVFTNNPTDTIARVNHSYELTINFKGVNYTAISKVNRTTSVDSIDVVYKEAGAFGGEAGYKCAFLGFDPTGKDADYYWIKSFRNNVMFNKGQEINLACDGAYSNAADGFPFIPPIAESITPGGEFFEKFDVVRVEIHSISEQTWNFLFQVQSQTTNSGLFATTPENIKSNVTSSDANVKVVGWFSMSAVGYREKIVQ